jgi:hypothetical protein
VSNKPEPLVKLTMKRLASAEFLPKDVEAAYVSVPRRACRSAAGVGSGCEKAAGHDSRGLVSRRRGVIISPGAEDATFIQLHLMVQRDHLCTVMNNILYLTCPNHIRPLAKNCDLSLPFFPAVRDRHQL